VQFTEGNLYAEMRADRTFDRYSNEYARYIWEAAETAGRKDLLDKIRPSLKAQMRLWWDVVSEDGYGYNWGRQSGRGQLSRHARNRGLPRVACGVQAGPARRHRPLINQAWNYLLHDYRNEAHLLSDLFALAAQLCLHLARLGVAADHRVLR